MTYIPEKRKPHFFVRFLLLSGICIVGLQACQTQTKQATGVPPAVSELLDSLKTISKNVPSDSGLSIQQKINRIAKQYGLLKEQVESYCRLGYITGLAQMDFHRGKLMVDSAAGLVQTNNRQELWPMVYLYYSILYKHDDSSLYYIKKVLPRLNQLNTDDQIIALGNIASIYSRRDRGEIARKYYLQALALAQKQNPPNLKAIIALYDNLAITYLFQHDTLRALQHWRKGYQLVTDSIERFGEIEYICGNFGQCYIEMGKPDSALPMIEKYAAIVKKNYTGKQQLLPNIYFAEIALLKKEYQKADTLLAAFGQYIDTIGATSPLLPGPWFVHTYYETLFRLKKAVGDYKAAVAVLEKKHHFNYLTSQKQNEKQLQQYERDLEKSKTDIALAEKEKTYAHNRLILYATIFSLILLLFVATGLVLIFRNKKRTEERKLRQLQQDTIIEKKELLLQAETSERKRIARELHDELGGALTVMAMATQNLKRHYSEAMGASIEILERNSNRFSAQINEIIWSLNDKNDTLESVLDYVHHYARQFFKDAGISHIIHNSVKTVSPSPLVIDGYKRRYLFNCIKECLTNIVKHSGATAVEIFIENEQEILTIRISDNGKGLPPASRLVKGNGLENIRRNIRALGGMVSWEQREGTLVIIQVPLPELVKDNPA